MKGIKNRLADPADFQKRVKIDNLSRSKNRRDMKLKLIALFLVIVFVRICPGWIAREGWKDVNGWTWFLFSVFVICLWVSYSGELNRRQRVKDVNQMLNSLSRMKRK